MHEEAVMAALHLPKQEQQKAIDKIRKLGIFHKNITLQKKGKALLRERTERRGGKMRTENEQQNDNTSNRMNVIENEERDIEKLEQVPSSSTVTPKNLAKPERRYTKWNDHDSLIARNYFIDFIMNKEYTGVKGSLPGKKMINAFLEKHSIFQGTSLSHDTCVSLVKTKIFNERKKERLS